MYDRKAPELLRQESVRGIAKHLTIRKLNTPTPIYKGHGPTIRDYVDKFMHRQSKLLLAAAKSQQETNDAHLKRRYANCKTTPVNDDYIRMVEAGDRKIMDIVKEIDLSPYVETIYQIGDYVLQRRRQVKATQTSTDRGGEALTLSRQPNKCPSSMDFGKRGTPSPTW